MPSEAKALIYERSLDRPSRPQPGWYYTALTCGLIPLGAGTAVFLLWVVFGSPWLIVAGLVTIGVGVVLFLLGAVFLTAYVLNERRLPGISRRHLYRRSAIVAAVLLLNFPITFAYAGAGVWLYERFVVTVVNSSSHPIDVFDIYGGGVHDTGFGVVAPGASKRRTVHFDRDGSFRYAMDWNGIKSSGDLAAHLNDGIGGAINVTVTDGRTTVTKIK